MMEDFRPSFRPEEDPSYILAMDEARDLGIRVDITREGHVQDPDGYWEARGEWEGQGRYRGRWIADIWDDSDDTYYEQPEPPTAYAISDTPAQQYGRLSTV